MTYKYDEPNKQLVENWEEPRRPWGIAKMSNCIYDEYLKLVEAYKNRPRIDVHEDLQKLLKDGQVIDEKEFEKFECDVCDGCGWYEGGIKLKTTCDECKGTGVLAIPLTKEASKPEKDFLKILEENYQAQISGYYNHDKTDEARKIRQAVINEYRDLIEIYKNNK